MARETIGEGFDARMIPADATVRMTDRESQIALQAIAFMLRRTGKPASVRRGDAQVKALFDYLTPEFETGLLENFFKVPGLVEVDEYQNDGPTFCERMVSELSDALVLFQQRYDSMATKNLQLKPFYELADKLNDQLGAWVQIEVGDTVQYVTRVEGPGTIAHTASREGRVIHIEGETVVVWDGKASRDFSYTVLKKVLSK